MSDADLRERERRIAAGDAAPGDVARAAREAARFGFGLAEDVRRFLGLWVYVEGARMNYRGLLREVHVAPDGKVVALVLEPAWRLGWWDTPEGGPRQGYHFKLNGPVIVPWEAVQALHEQFASWAKS